MHKLLTLLGIRRTYAYTAHDHITVRFDHEPSPAELTAAFETARAVQSAVGRPSVFARFTRRGR